MNARYINIPTGDPPNTQFLMMWFPHLNAEQGRTGNKSGNPVMTTGTVFSIVHTWKSLWMY